ncbi:MAG TPA: FAD-binding oxidoreductase [Thermoanaerobaculia bacterium]|jgi:FAD/FMN-containing dehydrogenase|nr:FAD-binding oxidoreductase [Thermoanaerobaculia bacterium]
MTDLQRAMAAGVARAVDDGALRGLKEQLRGDLVTPDDPRYGEARKVYNGMHDRRPSSIVRAADVADVMATVRFARERGVTLAVRGGGHSAPGFGTVDGGMVLDLGRLRGIRVDAARRRVRVEGGSTWSDVDHATHAFGLAVPAGIVSTTGVGGLTLGGGMGYLSRRCGLTVDNLLEADVVTANGELITCNEKTEPDLFWALRGGGGNFGVVTSFEYRLHPIREIYGGPTFYALDGSVLRAWRDFIVKAPAKLGALCGLTLAPPLPFLPTEWHGKPVAAVIACWSGPIEEGPKRLGRLAKWGKVVGSFVGPMPYPAINQLFNDLLPPGLQQYWKGSFAREISDGAIDAHVEHARATPTIESSAIIYPLDGACQRVGAEATAYPYRDATFSTVIAGAWHNRADSERNIRWVRGYFDALRPYSEDGGYVNFMGPEDQDRAPVNYRQNYDRLRRIKSRYDPGNLFRVNHNVPPGA